MLASAFLTITAAIEHTRSRPPTGQIPLTRNEVAGLFAKLVIQAVPGAWHCLRWPDRRGRQHRAQTCHYQRQARQR